MYVCMYVKRRATFSEGDGQHGGGDGHVQVGPEHEVVGLRFDAELRRFLLQSVLHAA